MMLPCCTPCAVALDADAVMFCTQTFCSAGSISRNRSTTPVSSSATVVSSFDQVFETRLPGGLLAGADLAALGGPGLLDLPGQAVELAGRDFFALWIAAAEQPGEFAPGKAPGIGGSRLDRRLGGQQAVDLVDPPPALGVGPDCARHRPEGR
jgi:hypothetical protein